MNQLPTAIQNKLDSAYKQIFGGLESILSGCVLYCSIVDTDRERCVKYMNSKGFPSDFLDMLENVGRGRITPRLLFLLGPGPERLQRVPFSEQERILNVGVEVAKVVGNEIIAVVKPVTELTALEAQTALNSSGNVSIAAQRELLSKRTITMAFKTVPFSLDGEDLLVKGIRIPFQELDRLYQAARQAHDKKVSFLERDMKESQIRRARP